MSVNSYSINNIFLLKAFTLSFLSPSKVKTFKRLEIQWFWRTCQRVMERAKGFEPSTPTLARLCSTPEKFSRPSENPIEEVTTLGEEVDDAEEAEVSEEVELCECGDGCECPVDACDCEDGK